jgi:anti-anti-sigma factor
MSPRGVGVSQFFEEGRDDGVRVVSVTGELDLLVADELVTVVRAAFSHQSGVELDLGELSFVDSSGLGALVRIRKEAEGHGIPLALTNVPPSTKRLLEVTGLAGTFDLAPARN